MVSKAADVTLNTVGATGRTKGLLQKDIEGSTDEQKVTIEANGTDISGDFNITAEMDAEAAKNEFNITAGTFPGESTMTTFAPGANFDATTGEVKMSYVAKIGDTEYPTPPTPFGGRKQNQRHRDQAAGRHQYDRVRNWTPVGWMDTMVRGVITLNGNGKTITGLSAPSLRAALRANPAL